MAVAFYSILIIGSIIAYYVFKARTISKLKNAYDESLKGNDKKAALDAGRKYYAKLRKDGRLTIYDEQAITNDIAAMDIVR